GPRSLSQAYPSPPPVPAHDALVAYCYRMRGSFHEAEDLTRETMPRAWRARDRYDPARVRADVRRYTVGSSRPSGA
ncbi:sigma factor, partial [Streptomyces diastatochromogenes]|uniref:sigma factor n=1 Tax=Streptomyces diastatochromogenes TaxID=42236 RepID=UPI00369227AA